MAISVPLYYKQSFYCPVFPFTGSIIPLFVLSIANVVTVSIVLVSIVLDQFIIF